MKKRFFLFAISALLIFLGSCSKGTIENTVNSLTPDIETPEDDDDTNEKEENQPTPVFTAKVNEAEFEATVLISQSLTGATVSIQPFGYSLVITGQYLSQDLKSSEVILLFIYGADFEELSENTEFNTIVNIAAPQVPGAFAIYGGDPNTAIEDDNFGTSVLEEIMIKITAIDKVNQRISGAFDFVAVDEERNNRYEVTEGLFTDLSYEIQ